MLRNENKQNSISVQKSLLVNNTMQEDVHFKDKQNPSKNPAGGDKLNADSEYQVSSREKTYLQM